MKKGQRCLLTGKLVEGKDVVIASELEEYIKKQGIVIKLKNEKTMDLSDCVVFDDSTDTCPV